MSEKALVKEEKEETRQMCTMAGMKEHQVSEEDMTDNVPAGTFNPHLAMGEGYRTLSWIWYSTTGGEINNSVSMGASKYLVSI